VLSSEASRKKRSTSGLSHGQKLIQILQLANRHFASVPLNPALNPTPGPMETRCLAAALVNLPRFGLVMITFRTTGTERFGATLKAARTRRKSLLSKMRKTFDPSQSVLPGWNAALRRLNTCTTPGSFINVGVRAARSCARAVEINRSPAPPAPL
jgi:hypothetical protein